MRFTLYQKILLAFTPVGLLFFIIAGISLIRIRVMNNLVHDNYNDSTVNIKLIDDAIVSALHAREHLLLLNTLNSPEEKIRQEEIITYFEKQTLELLAQYEIRTEDERTQELLGEFQNAWNDYTTAKDEIISLSLVGEVESATFLFSSGVAQSLDLAIDLLLLVQDIEDNQALSRYDTSQLLYETGIFTVLGGTIIAVGLAVALAFFTSRNVGRNVAAVAHAAQKVAHGDLSQRVTVTSHDEIRLLADSFNEMAAQLQEHTEAEAQARKQAEQAKEEAIRANQAKSIFLANMSHELRTPLNAVLGFAQLMTRDEAITTTQKRHVDIIHRSGNHLLDLLNDVLEISKIEAGQLKLNETDFDLYRLLDTLTQMVEAKVERAGLLLNKEIAPDVPHYIRTDESKLRQVVLNLLSNSIKFTPLGGKITLEVTYANEMDRLQIVVCDTGAGISPEEQVHLFSPFAQTESGRKAQQGTGLGLTISRQFAQLMGGDITVESEVGKGSCFTVTIQIEEATAILVDEANSRRIKSLAPNQPIYRILVVEDKWENRALLVELLQTIGFEVREAVNGQIAIEVFKNWQPDLIFMDMRMPIMDGEEATKMIRIMPTGNSTKIIALTASSFEHERNYILSFGCDDFISKPFKELELLQRISSHLGVVYLYEDMTSTTTSTIPSMQNTKEGPLSVDDFAQLPASLRQQIYEAATVLRTGELLNLLTQVQEYNPQLASQIKILIDNFDFDTLIELSNPSS